MLKAVNDRLVLLGLSDANIERLQDGQPIIFDGTMIGLPNKRVIIVHGKNEQTIAQALVKAGAIGPDTKFK